MKQPIFNSLGSNYTADFVNLAWDGVQNPTQDKHHARKKLADKLSTRFSGTSILVYKGRDAIELAVRSIADLSPAQHAERKLGVLTQGLACHAIEEGIIRGGMVPVYVDLEPGTLGPSIRTLEEGMRWAKAHDIEVCGVFLQHTLGYANPVRPIRQFCRRYHLIMIEDLAQSFGADDGQGTELGQHADIVICSFGRDKILDAVSGGAVVFGREFQQKVPTVLEKWVEEHQPQTYPPTSVVRKEMIYPRLTALIQKTHRSGIGKLIFQLAKSLQLITSPIASSTHQPTQLPAAYAELVLWQLQHLEQQLQHRRDIARVYIRELVNIEGVSCLAQADTFQSDVHLRVPLLFDTPEQMRAVISECQKQNIYITDRWYRDVVDSGSLRCPTLYQTGSCPVAEQTAQRLLNLPTHHKVSIDDAQQITVIIKKTLKKSL